MTYTLNKFAEECHDALKADPGPAGREKVLDCVRKALKDEAFIKAYLPDTAEKERNIIFEDPDLGFCICAHVYKGAKKGFPHDHGSTWAIYGQAVGETEMTDWQVVSPAGCVGGRRGLQALGEGGHCHARRGPRASIDFFYSAKVSPASQRASVAHTLARSSSSRATHPRRPPMSAQRE